MNVASQTRQSYARAVALVALLVLCAAGSLKAETPAAVLNVFRTAVESLASQDLNQFMGLFDRSMPGYEELRHHIGLRIGTEGLGSTIEVVTDEGDEAKRVMQLDWLLRPEHGSAKRAVVKCTLEHKGKTWKIVALDPVAFFTPE
ncbi:MAG: hypothetical protein ABI824_10065 [Acidobacteriota bacterium]